MLGNALCKLALANDGRGQHGIGGGHAGGHAQALEPVQRRDQPPDKQADDEPAKGHDRDEQDDNGTPVLLHVILGQLDANGKALHNEDDARELEGDLVRVAPRLRVDQVGGVRAEDNAAEGGDSGLPDVYALLDDGGAEHEERGKGTENDID